MKTSISTLDFCRTNSNNALTIKYVDYLCTWNKIELKPGPHVQRITIVKHLHDNSDGLTNAHRSAGARWVN